MRSFLKGFLPWLFVYFRILHRITKLPVVKADR